MAVQGLSVVVIASLILSAMILVVESGNQIALSSVSVDNDDDVLIITVAYAADYKPYIAWVAPRFKEGGGMVNLDFQQSDTFNESQGQTTMKIQHEVARTQDSRVFNRILIFRNQDCEMTLHFPTYGDLIASPASTQVFHDLSLVLEEGGRDLDPGEEVVFTSSRMDLYAKLSSPELPKFKVDNMYAKHSRFEYTRGDFAGRKNDYGYRRSVIEYKGDWSGNTTAKMSIVLGNSPMATGIFTLNSVSLKQRSGTESLVPTIYFTQNVYLLQYPGEEIVRANTVYITNDHSHYLTEFDMPMNLQVPQFSFSAVGNPLPQVSLYRACAELTDEEVEVFETRVKSKFEIINFFRFKNATDAVSGSYRVVARSGTMEAREIMSLGIWR